MRTRNVLLLATALTVGLVACSSADATDDRTSVAETSPSTPTTPTTDEPTSDTDIPDTTRDETTETPSDTIADDATAEDVAVFDPSVVHTIAVEFDEDDYDAMIATYQDTGDKEWIEATVTIDGTRFERVGLRLKGNSSLAGLGGAGGIGRGVPGQGPTGEADGTEPDGTEPDRTDPDNTEPSDGGDPDADRTVGLVEFGGASADEPESLPWLIRLDEFVDDQTYMGYEDFVVRSNNTETALNEAVSLALLAEAGLASQEAIATRFSVNGGDEVLRLVVEHPDDDQWYETSFDGDGALYKAESTGDWTYRGDDPASYEEVFDQEGGSEVADLSPLIEFLDFINNSDDATFDAELPERLDVDAFATYLAMMELIGNTDDIDGPGNNAYLWWDADTGQFTVVPWDMNLTLSSGMGFPGGSGGRPANLPEGVEPPTGGFPGGTLPDGTEFPGGTLPDGTEFPADLGDLPDGGPGPGGAVLVGEGFGGRSNPLVERFLANEEFNALYETRLEELTEQLVTSGNAASVLADWVDVLRTHATDLVSAETIESEAAAVRDLLAD